MAESRENRIKQLDASTTRRICSGQVITSMAVAVKELIENAIDARATCISIRFSDFGKELIEVMDNGCGIENYNFELLGKRNCTSKMDLYEDLDNIGTFGFRGEALSSLCNIANVSVHTRHATDAIGTVLKLDTNGSIERKEMMAREIGTTVSLSQLFYSLPVRRKELISTHRRVFDKTLSLIYQYCVGIVSLKIACFHKQNQDGRFSNLFTSTGLSVQSNIIEIFDYKQFTNLMPFVCNTDLEDTSAVPIDFEMTGYISKPDTGCGRSATDRQYFYLNERPCDLVSVGKRINQIYRTYNRNQYPFVLLKISVDESLIDRNLTPDKRKILLADNHYIFKVIQHSLDLMFSRESADVMSMSTSQLLSNYLNSSSLKRNQESPDQSMSEQVSKIFKRCPSPCDSLFESDLKNDSINNEKPFNNSNKKVPLNSIPASYIEDSSHTDNPSQSESSSSKLVFESLSTPSRTSICQLAKHPFFASLNQFKPKLAVDSNMNEHIKQSVHNGVNNSSNDQNFLLYNEPSISENNNQADRSIEEFEIDIDCSDDMDVNEIDSDKKNRGKDDIEELENFDICNRKQHLVDCCIEDICEQYTTCINQSQSLLSQHEANFNAKIIPEDNEKALNELRHTLSKQSFSQMNVVGQFNLGFIIARLDSNLFIIDQHAIDERYNFETLLNDPKIDNQNLVCPLNLRLNSLNEIIIIDHMDTFKKLGFGIVLNKEASVGQRVFLTKIPLGKEWVGGRSDVEEIIAAIRDSPTGDILEGKHFMLSGLRREVAYRACRSSVMIGEALNRSHMVKMLGKMGALRDPWHCAHNRPTIRHLLDLDHFKSLR